MSPLKIETNLEPSKDKTEDKSPPTKNIGGLLFGGFAGGGGLNASNNSGGGDGPSPSSSPNGLAGGLAQKI